MVARQGRIELDRATIENIVHNLDANVEDTLTW
jgi:hypothetical protein